MSPRLFSNKVSCMYHLSHVAAFVEVIVSYPPKIGQ